MSKLRGKTIPESYISVVKTVFKQGHFAVNCMCCTCITVLFKWKCYPREHWSYIFKSSNIYIYIYYLYNHIHVFEWCHRKMLLSWMLIVYVIVLYYSISKHFPGHLLNVVRNLNLYDHRPEYIAKLIIPTSFKTLYYIHFNFCPKMHRVQISK